MVIGREPSIMVKVIKAPGISRRYLTSEQLSGWPDGIAYTPGWVSKARKLKRLKAAREKKTLMLRNAETAPPVAILSVGVEL